jgi:hypothetical protein
MATDADVIAAILTLGAGRVAGETLADWVRQHRTKRRQFHGGVTSALSHATM